MLFYVSIFFSIFVFVYGARRLYSFVRGARLDDRLELPELKPEKRYTSEERCPTCGRLV